MEEPSPFTIVDLGGPVYGIRPTPEAGVMPQMEAVAPSSYQPMGLSPDSESAPSRASVKPEIVPDTAAPSGNDGPGA